MTRWIVLVVLACVMMSCARTYERHAEFIHEEYAPYEATGTARICGQAYLSVLLRILGRDTGKYRGGGILGKSFPTKSWRRWAKMEWEMCAD